MSDVRIHRPDPPRSTYTFPDPQVPAEVAELIGRQQAAIEEQMGRVATLSGRIGQLRDAIRQALELYGTTEGRMVLRNALQDRTP